jgi:hypothetical protein
MSQFSNRSHMKVIAMLHAAQAHRRTRRFFPLLSLLPCLSVAWSGVVLAATDEHQAKRISEARTKGLVQLVAKHVEKMEGNACDVLQVDHLSATMLSSFSLVEWSGKDRNGPLTTWLPKYAGLFLVSHNCYYGSTMAGVGSDPVKSSIWRITFEVSKPLKKYPRVWPTMNETNLKFEFVKSVHFPTELFP